VAARPAPNDRTIARDAGRAADQAMPHAGALGQPLLAAWPASPGDCLVDIEMRPMGSGTTSCAAPSVKHIEERGVSAAFLLHLLGTKLNDVGLAHEASTTASEFLNDLPRRPRVLPRPWPR
jgi:hypothetical protein